MIYALFFQDDFDTPEYWILYVIPAAIPLLPGIPLFIKLLKLFSYSPDSNRLDVVYTMIPIMLIMGGCIAFQNFLFDWMGDVVQLENVQQVNPKTAGRFYMIKDLELEKFHSSSHYSSRVEGKTGGNLVLTLSFACAAYGYANKEMPVLITPKPSKPGHSNSKSGEIFAPPEGINTKNEKPDNYGERALIRHINLPYPKAFICTSFSTTISNRLSKQDEDVATNDFYESSVLTYSRLQTENFSYYRRSGNNDQRKLFEVAAKSLQFAEKKIAEPIMLVPQKGAFRDRAKSSLRLFFAVFLAGNFIWLVMILVRNTIPEKKQNSD